MITSTATAALEGIPPGRLSPYAAYFASIQPKDDTEVFRRALFAFASVHTSWQKNVDMYALLWDMDWRSSQEELRDRIFESRAGLTEGRTRNIWEFSRKFEENPDFYRRKPDEMWVQFRDRIEADTLGLGHAKSSFFVELCYPNDAEVVCGDTHQLQLYGLKGNSSPGRKMYDYVELHWVSECKRLRIPPVASRWYLWDKKQGSTDGPRYWSYCLEGDSRPSLVMPRQLEIFTWKETAGPVQPRHAHKQKPAARPPAERTHPELFTCRDAFNM